jgi:hypothetical protein
MGKSSRKNTTNTNDNEIVPTVIVMDDFFRFVIQHSLIFFYCMCTNVDNIFFPDFTNSIP